MANLAIRGHATHGKEVIELLEMLGGQNKFSCYGESESYAFFIIDGIIDCDEMRYLNDHTIYTLEGFLEKFPYKVGDRVRVPEYESEVCISKMYWDGSKVQYEVVTDEVEWYSAEELNLFNAPYKEETMDKANKAVFDANAQCCDIMNNLIKGKTMKDNLVTEEDYEKTLEVEQEYIAAAERLLEQLADSTRWKCKDFDSQKMIALFLKKNTSVITEKEDSIIVDIPKGYEFAGVDDDNQQVIFEKIGYQYPKTYEECCEVFEDNFLNVICLSDDEKDLFYNIIKIKRCRDAYWRLYGEQMGLGKPWKPKWEIDNVKYSILVVENEIRIGDNEEIQRLLVFPTAEMRDAFYENFKDLIEFCKELL